MGHAWLDPILYWNAERSPQASAGFIGEISVTRPSPIFLGNRKNTGKSRKLALARSASVPDALHLWAFSGIFEETMTGNGSGI
jgi:hypothetical protein